MDIGKLSFLKLLLKSFRFIGLNLYAWSQFPFALLPHPKIRKGDRFMAVEDIAVKALIHHSAPFTDGFRCVIPENTILIVSHDSDRISSGFVCIPEDRVRFEEMHVPDEIRRSPTYGGCSFALRYVAIRRKLKRI